MRVNQNFGMLFVMMTSISLKKKQLAFFLNISAPANNSSGTKQL